MNNLCEICRLIPACSAVKNGTHGLYNVCSVCCHTLVLMGFNECNIPAGIVVETQIRTDECECGNKDKPKFTQLHSHWCKVYRREF